MKGFRTILANVVAIGGVVVGTYGNVIPPKYMPHIVVGLGISNIILRTITTTPIGQSTNESNDTGKTGL